MRAENIKKLRNAKSLSMEQVRELTGLSKSTISDSENPNGNPTEKTLEKLAEVYGVDVNDFYKNNSTDTTTDNNKMDNKLEEEFPEGVYVLRRASKELSPEAKEQMLKIMKTFLEEDDDE